MWTVFIWDCCEHGNEPSLPVRDGEIFDLLRNYMLLKKDSTPWSWSETLI
jgi:hypothetical protein